MEIIIGVLVLIAGYYIYTSRKIEEKTKSIYSKKLDMLKIKADLLEKSQVDPTQVLNIEIHKRVLSEEKQKYNFLLDEFEETRKKLLKETEKNAKIVSQRKSSEVRTGQISEQLMPILQDFPYDAKKLRGIFSPIDYVYFGDDEIILLEFKSGESKLSTKQKNIKRLVEENKVTFKTFRLNGKGLNEV
jgi:predicted Holliday junction resolvase-like endonuclease